MAGLVVIVSKAPNAAPVWTKAAYSASAVVGQPFEFDLAGKVSDPDGDAITITIVRAPNGITATIADNKLKFTPPAVGTYEFTLKASDGKGGEAEAGLVVVVSAIPNTSPVWKQGTYTRSAEVGQTIQINLAPEVTDEDGDPITLTLVGETYGAQINEQKVFVWNTTGRQPGLYQFLVKATDSKGAYSYAHLEITLIPAPVPNQSPRVLPIPEQVTYVGKAVEIDLTKYVSDPNGDPITIQKVSGPGVVIGSKYFWFPTAKLSTPATVQLKFTDGKGGEATASFKVSAPYDGAASLTIYVTDYKSGPATAGATVKVKVGSETLEMVTDNTGKVTFSNITLSTTTDVDVVIEKSGYARTYIEGLRLAHGQNLEFETQMRVAKLGPTSSEKPFELSVQIRDANGNDISTTGNVVTTDSIQVTGTATTTEYSLNLWYVKVGGVPGAGTFTAPRTIGYTGTISAVPSVAEFEGMVPVYIDVYDMNDNRYEKIVYIYVSRMPAQAITPYIVQKYTTVAPNGYNIISYTRAQYVEYYGKKDPKPTAAPSGTNLFIRVFWRPWYSASGTTQPKAYRIYRSFDGVSFQPIATVPNTVSSYSDYSAQLEVGKRVWYAVSSVYDGYETPYTVIGDVIPLPLLQVTYISPLNGSTGVPRDPEFKWQFSGVSTTAEGDPSYLYDIWLYDLVVNDYCYYSLGTNPTTGQYSILPTLVPSVSFKFSDYHHSKRTSQKPWAWIDFAAKDWYPYDKLQAFKTYEWGNELLAAQIIDPQDRSRALSILVDDNNYFGLGNIRTDIYHRFITGEN
ncbi:hypothetical protein A4H02_09090 [Fervidobacterium thailandense]|uniref:Uncharacterized protein n=1 Tax=Fervidobacterium thailandense TaxID=1008305 RepID=A0A1E3G1M2_9BACT|nr:hypothetical protein A4H02_09090 [Fervidobacterium thailandense]